MMVQLHNQYEQLPEYGKRSQDFAAAYSAEVWCERWKSIFQKITRNAPL